ncbi:unnamed protein product, partial [Phaeothamnion confervicola]
MKRTTVLAALSAALSIATPLAATAQAWPSQPIRLVVPFPPGGTTDQIARHVQPHLQQALGVQVLVENRAGASGAIGTAVVAKAPPDGATFAVVFDTHGVNPSLIPNMTFDTLNDLAPVMLVGKSPMVFVTHPSTSYRTLGEVIAAAKAKPDSLGYGTIGSGSLAHLFVTMAGRQNGFSLTHVPYKGGGPLITDSVAGHVSLSVATVALFAPHIQSGKLRPLAVTSAKRFPNLPDVPAVSEAGLPGMEAESWWGVFAPAKTPAAIVARM